MVGSILGTFLTGFVLIDFLGTKGVILVLGTVLALGATFLGDALCMPSGRASPWASASSPSRRRAGSTWSRVIPAVNGKSFVEMGEMGRARARATQPTTAEDLAWVDESDYYYIKVENEPEDGGEIQRRTLVLDNLIHGYFILEPPRTAGLRLRAHLCPGRVPGRQGRRQGGVQAGGREPAPEGPTRPNRAERSLTPKAAEAEVKKDPSPPQEGTEPSPRRSRARRRRPRAGKADAASAEAGKSLRPAKGEPRARRLRAAERRAEPAKTAKGSAERPRQSRTADQPRRIETAPGRTAEAKAEAAQPEKTGIRRTAKKARRRARRCHRPKQIKDPQGDSRPGGPQSGMSRREEPALYPARRVVEPQDPVPRRRCLLLPAPHAVRLPRDRRRRRRDRPGRDPCELDGHRTLRARRDRDLLGRCPPVRRAEPGDQAVRPHLRRRVQRLLRALAPHHPRVQREAQEDAHARTASI